MHPVSEIPIHYTAQNNFTASGSMQPTLMHPTADSNIQDLGNMQLTFPLNIQEEEGFD